MQLSIKKDYFWNTFGVLLQNAISPLLLIVVTRVNGIDDSGLFSFAFAVSLVLWTIALWGGRTYQVSDAKRVFAFKSYVIMRLILGVLTMLLAIIFVFASGYTVEKLLIILLLTLFKVVESVADVVYGILQVKGALYLSGVSLLMKSVVGFALFTFVLMMTKDLLTSTLALIVVNVLILGVFDIPSALRLKDKSRYKSNSNITLTHSFREALTIMQKSSPVFAMGILSILSINIPRYFVDQYHQSEIGYFGILAMPVTLITLLITFILQPNIVGLSELYAKKDLVGFHKAISKIVTIMIAAIVAILLGTVAFGVPILNAIFALKFDDYMLALVLIVLGAAANTFVGVMTNSLTVMRHFRGQFITLLIANILLVPACIATIPTYGLLGAVILYGLANAVQAIALFMIYRFYIMGGRSK